MLQSELKKLRMIKLAMMSLIIVFRGISVATTTASPGSNPADPTYDSMKQLLTDLMIGYDNSIRPRRNLSEAVMVNMTFNIHSLLEFDISRQKMTIMGFFLFHWVDELLVWNVSDYNNIAMITLPVQKIWTPNFIYISAYDGRGLIPKETGVIMIFPNGKIDWSAESKYQLLCEDIDITFFPFDKQTCAMQIYMDSTMMHEVDLIPLRTHGALNQMSLNSAWKLTRYSFDRMFYHGVSIVNIKFELQRRPEFYMCTIIAPLILLSVLNVGVFIVPTESGEKGSMAVTIFLSYGVFIMMISNELPVNSLNVSHLLIYILLLLVLSVVAVLYSFVQSWIYAHHADKIVRFTWMTKLKQCLRISTADIGHNDTDHNEKGLDESSVNVSTLHIPSPKKLSNVKVKDKTTWKDVLRMMDVIIFLVILLTVLIATSASFAYIANN